MPRMTREEMDRYDREMMGIMNPQAAMPAAVPAVMPQASRPLNDPEGRPLTREYSLDDIRRFFGFGSRPAMSPAEAADAAQMYVRAQAPAPFAPNAPPPPPPAPPPAPTRPPAPARRQAPVMRGLPTNEADFAPPRPDTLGGVSPADMAAMGQMAPALQPAPVVPPPAPVPAMPVDPIGPPPARAIPRNPQDLARALEQQAARERGAGMRVQPMTDVERQRLMQRGFGVRVP